jgi:hypothetical protein
MAAQSAKRGKESAGDSGPAEQVEEMDTREEAAPAESIAEASSDTVHTDEQ